MVKEKIEAGKVMLGFIRDEETQQTYNFINDISDVTYMAREIGGVPVATIYSNIDVSFAQKFVGKVVSVILVNTSDPTNSKADTVISLNQHAVAHIMLAANIESLNPLTITCHVNNYSIKINRPLRDVYSTLKDTRWMKK
jgi:hypothetical protein